MVHLTVRSQVTPRTLTVSWAFKKFWLMERVGMAGGFLVHAHFFVISLILWFSAQIWRLLSWTVVMAPLDHSHVICIFPVVSFVLEGAVNQRWKNYRPQYSSLRDSTGRAFPIRKMFLVAHFLVSVCPEAADPWSQTQSHSKVKEAPSCFCMIYSIKGLWFNGLCMQSPLNWADSGPSKDS